MKKRLALVVAAATVLAGLGSLAAFADTINTPYGNVNIDPNSAVWFDGAESNPAPLSGYLIIHRDGRVSCGATDGPDAGHTPTNLLIENGCAVSAMLPNQTQVGGGPGVMIPNLPGWAALPQTPNIPGFSWPSQLPAPKLPTLPKVPGATVNLKHVPNVPNMPKHVPGADVKLHNVPKVPALPKGLPAGVPSTTTVLGAVPSLSSLTSKVPALGSTALPSTTGVVSTVTNTLSTLTSALPIHLPTI